MASNCVIPCKKCRAIFTNRMDLSNHLMSSPGCKVVSHFQCSTCRAVFLSHQDLKSHLYNNLRCKTIPKSQNPHALAAELNGGGQTGGFLRFSTPTQIGQSSKLHPSTSSLGGYGDRSLLGAMEKELNKPKSKKCGLESSVLSMVAEGDDELVMAYSRLTVNPTTGKKNLSEELVQAATRKAKIDVDQIATSISRSQIVSICFVLDTTGSMGSYISGVKEQIIEIVNQVKASGCFIAGLAFVGYKDWCDGQNHFEVLQFTRDVTLFKSFVSSIKATGGGDTPEDVIGGLDRAVSLIWPEKSGSRILFHLGDAPPHGKERYHSHADDYPNGHPRDKPLETLFREMHHKKLNYYFGRINKECEKMIRVFEIYYGAKIDSFDTSKASLISSSVTASVMSTISATASTSSKPRGKMLRSYMLDEEEPDWSKIPQLQATILTYALPSTVEDITSFAKLEDKVKKCLLQIAPQPFAVGSIRLAYYGKILYSSKDASKPEMSSSAISTDVVFKEMVSLPTVATLDRQRYTTNLEIQTIASKIAFEFNDRLSRTTRDPNMKIKYLMAKVVRMSMENGDQRFMAYEKRFHGPTPEMLKYTNNLDYVINPDTLDADGRKKLELAVAFSHFSYDFTGGYLLVCDLQGISTSDGKGEPILLLTDPAIHCPKHLRFGKTNLGAIGINKFFSKHVCNQYCSALGLTVPKMD